MSRQTSGYQVSLSVGGRVAGSDQREGPETSNIRDLLAE
jgi:hypothetical protein